MSDRTEASPPHSRWNFVAFIANDIFSWAALSFVSATSILPALSSQLTDSAPLIGLSATLFTGSWSLPQLLAARVIRNRQRKRPYMLLGSIGRLALWLVAGALWAGLGRHPNAMLGVLYGAVVVWRVTDALFSLSALDIFARGVAERWRGRAVGTGQFAGGIASVGVGALVAWLLRDAGLGFPSNYAWLFALAGLTLIPSTVALALVREPDDHSSEAAGDEYASHAWWHIVRSDRHFRQLILCRMLLGMASLAMPFYVIHAADVLHLPQSAIGTFVIAQTVGRIVTGAISGLVNDRWGPQVVLRIAGAATTVAPLFALAAHLGTAQWLISAYPVVFVALGMSSSAIWMGFLNTLLMTADSRLRPTYIGLANTLVGLLALAPVLGGWLVQATSYAALFAITAALTTTGLLMALRLGGRDRPHARAPLGHDAPQE